METNIGNFLLYFDISSSQTPAFTQLCPLSIGYDQGESLDTWNDLCSKISNNIKTLIDPTWSLSFKFDADDSVAQFIIGKEYSVGTDATVGVRLVNKLKGATGKQLEFTATLSNITYEVLPEEVLQIDFDLKVHKGSTFVETDYTGSI